MRKCLGALTALMLVLGPVAAARADGLGPARNYVMILAVPAFAIIIAGVALTLAVIKLGLWLARRHKD